MRRSPKWPSGSLNFQSSRIIVESPNEAFFLLDLRPPGRQSIKSLKLGVSLSGSLRMLMSGDTLISPLIPRPMKTILGNRMMIQNIYRVLENLAPVLKVPQS